MGSAEKTLAKILSGRSDANIALRDLRGLLLRLGFEERTKGGHHLFRKSGVPVLINIQEAGGKAKPYQVRQVRKVILDYKLMDKGNG
jgi:predicted RNA binding protein YcfA (HicA-like mRNA interferase family)